MRGLRSILMIAGVALALVGLLWIGQGLGYIQWPRSSFMIDQTIWANYGAAIAALGLLLILVARRIR